MNRLAVISLGSNLGDSRGTVLEAMDGLRSRSAGGWRRSSLYESSPVDCPVGSPRFVNAAVAFLPLPDETPDTLLDWLLVLEKKWGRLPKQRLNEPRPLDLDLVAFGDVRVSTTRLALPHPRAHLRRFVLEPVAEILPTLVLPGFVVCVSEMLGSLPAGETVSRLPDP